MSFAEQAEPKGTADAVLAVERFTGSSPFLVLNADNLYPATAVRDPLVVTALSEGGDEQVMAALG